MELKIIAITQARMSSSRFPGKVLQILCGSPLLEIHLTRIKQSKLIAELVVATTTNTADAPILSLCNKTHTKYFRGSEEDVLDRFYQAALPHMPDLVVRLTSDCPLIDPALIDAVILECLVKKLDYVSNSLEPSFPDGEDVEVFKFSALEKAWREAKTKSDREHVTPFIWRNSSFNGGNLFKAANYNGAVDYSSVRLTIDEPQDFEVLKQLVEAIGVFQTWKEYADIYLAQPSIYNLNFSLKRNEGYSRSVQND